MISHDKLDGSTRKSQVLHIVIPSKNKLDVHRTNLKASTINPFGKRETEWQAMGFFPSFVL